MSRTVFPWLAGGVGVLLAAIPLLAHHNITGKFDPARTRTLNGMVTKLDWANPHIHILADELSLSLTVLAYPECAVGSVEARPHRVANANLGGFRCCSEITIAAVNAADVKDNLVGSHGGSVLRTDVATLTAIELTGYSYFRR